MRIIFYTGKGGVGKTSISAATGLKCAQAGQRTLILSLDIAHSLADVFDLDRDLTDQAEGKPCGVADHLDIQEIDLQKEIETNWSEIYTYISTVLQTTGVEDVIAEEMAILPGMEEISLLLHINRYYKEDAYDTLILDCAPTGESLRFISMPTALEWYMKKLFRLERNMFRLSRPVLKTVSPVPLPKDSYFENIQQLYKRLEGVDELLHDPEMTTVRLVTQPEQMVIRETRRAFMYFCLYGLTIDQVIVNRILPGEAEGDFYRGWVESQEKRLKEIERSFTPVPIRRVPLGDSEVLGLESLDKLGGQLYGEENPAEVYYSQQPYEFTREDGQLLVKIQLPFIAKGEVDLHRTPEGLVVRVGSFKKQLALPRSYLRARPQGAKLEEREIVIRFKEESQE
jgi:arsenite-transporting ATPase